MFDPSKHLVLFDIDGTLLRTEGVGVAAMLRAFKRLYGDHGFSFDGVEIAGALDGLLYARMTEQHGLAADERTHAEFQRIYGEELASVLTPQTVRRMPGTQLLVDMLAATGTAVGLLTGNYQHTAMMKIEAAGFGRSHFPFGAFGADGPSRRHLTPVAIARAASHHGRSFDPACVTIIGDTRHDIDCAKAHGCRAIGVGTGRYTTRALRAVGADLALDNLSDAEAVANWILG